MRRGTHETKIKAEMQADETRDRAEMRSLCRHNMAVLPTNFYYLFNHEVMFFSSFRSFLVKHFGSGHSLLTLTSETSRGLRMG